MQKQPRLRTLTQNSALHLYYTHLADALNSAGLDMRATLKPEIEIPWDANSIKNYLWRPIQKMQLGKESTTTLTTKEIDIVFDTLNRHLADKFGLHIDFPNIETLMLNEESKKI